MNLVEGPLPTGIGRQLQNDRKGMPVLSYLRHIFHDIQIVVDHLRHKLSPHFSTKQTACTCNYSTSYLTRYSSLTFTKIFPPKILGGEECDLAERERERETSLVIFRNSWKKRRSGRENLSSRNKSVATPFSARCHVPFVPVRVRLFVFFRSPSFPHPPQGFARVRIIMAFRVSSHNTPFTRSRFARNCINRANIVENIRIESYFVAYLFFNQSEGRSILFRIRPFARVAHFGRILFHDRTACFRGEQTIFQPPFFKVLFMPESVTLHENGAQRRFLLA